MDLTPTFSKGVLALSVGDAVQIAGTQPVSRGFVIATDVGGSGASVDGGGKVPQSIIGGGAATSGINGGGQAAQSIIGGGGS